jgi:predicted ArsR family transcriptional regulator
VRWNKRFFESTRGRVVALLRRRAQTVDELAAELGLTDNAVRAHLATLERDGVIVQESVRRGMGSGKPAYVYALAPDAAREMSRAYAPVLAALIAVLRERLGDVELGAVLRETGRRLGGDQVGRAAGPGARVAAAAQMLNDLGGDVAVEDTGAKLFLRGHGCPLAEVTRSNPEACRLVERLVADVTGGRVRERCKRGDQPSCCFELVLPKTG